MIESTITHVLKAVIPSPEEDDVVRLSELEDFVRRIRGTVGPDADAMVRVIKDEASDPACLIFRGDGQPAPVDLPSSKGKPCKTCGCDVTLHHKLRCENEACPGLCNGWECPEHGIVLCGCTYSGGPSPVSDYGPDGKIVYVPGAPSGVKP